MPSPFPAAARLAAEKPRALILAAGVGRRLGGEPPPKALLRFAGNNLLARHLTILRGFFGAAETAASVRWTEELSAAPERPGQHWIYHEDSLTEPGRRVVQRIENFCPFHAGFDQLIREGALARWTGPLMGGPVVLFKEKINFKMPGAPGFKAHQDQQAGWGRYAPISVTAMVTMDPATIENGCLEMVAGRHREGLIGEKWNPLRDEDLDLRPVPTAPGAGRGPLRREARLLPAGH